MNRKLPLLFLLLLFCRYDLAAQKPFSEGIIVYKVTLETADHASFAGTYTLTFKGGQIKKELKLDNGYGDAVILNSLNNTVYSLQNRDNHKYAIELSMADVKKTQEKFAGFTVANEENTSKKMAGCAAYKGNINYHDGASSEVIYTKDWQPMPISFERFPGAHFLPLDFSYTDENNISMHFAVERIVASPVENGIFRIPTDYKIISNADYKKLSK